MKSDNNLNAKEPQQISLIPDDMIPSTMPSYEDLLRKYENEKQFLSNIRFEQNVLF